jgi:hypothetical protein
MTMMGVWVTGNESARADGDAIRPAASHPLSFRLATTTPIRGFERMTISKSALYVAPRVALSGDSVSSAAAIDARSGTDVEMTVRPEVVGKLAATMRKFGADWLAAFAGERPVAAGKVTLNTTDGKVTINGLSQRVAKRLARVLNGDSIAALGPTIKLAVSAPSVKPGGTVTVDLFATNIPNLRTYQMALDIQGGSSGQLTVPDLRIDSGRKDFVFGTQKKIDAVDKVGGRLGALLFNGSVDVATSVYLGTCTVQASADAAGVFHLDLRTADNSSFLKDGQNLGIGFFTEGATITVGEAQRVKKPGK